MVGGGSGTNVHLTTRYDMSKNHIELHIEEERRVFESPASIQSGLDASLI